MPDSGSDTVTQKTEPWGPVQQYLKDSYGQAMLAGSNAMPFYPSNTFAPMNDLQVGGQVSALDYAQNRFQPGVSYNQAMLQKMMESPDQVLNNPTVQGMMDRNQSNVTDWLQRKALPGIRSGASLAGQFGGSRQGIAEGVAIGDAAQSLADANAQTMSSAYGQALGSQATAAGLMPNALQQGFQGAQVAMDIGNQTQQQNQRYIDEMMQRYYYPETKTWDMLGQQTAIYNGAQPYRTSSTTQPGGSSAAGALGGAMAGAGLAGSIGGSLASMGLGTAAGGVGPSAFLAGGMANPAMLPLIIGGGLLGALR